MVTAAAAAKLLQSCPTLCDPIDGSPPSSAVLGILQAKTLEWVAISFSWEGWGQEEKGTTGDEMVGWCKMLCLSNFLCSIV